jgi:hypothetical protein
VESDKDSAPASISNTKNCLHLNGDLDNPNVSKVDWEVNDQSDLQQENHIEDQETPTQRDVSAEPNVRNLIWPSWMSMKQIEKLIVMVNVMKPRTIKGNMQQ